MLGCVVCEAFPGHRGPHRSGRELSTLLFAAKRRRTGPAGGSWFALPGSATRSGEPILASLQFTDLPEARLVEGIWLRPDRGSLASERSSLPPTPTTYSAPAERASEEEIEAARKVFLLDPLAMALLDALPDMALVLNVQRQIVAVNQAVREVLGPDAEGQLLGLRPGEVVGCMAAMDDAPGGCGTGRQCLECGALNAILGSLESRGTVSHECRLRTCREADGGALELEVLATFAGVQGGDFVVLCLRDISAEKRRQVLEQVFFHDVLNTAMEIFALARLMRNGLDGDQRRLYENDLEHLSRQIMEELATHRDLLSAERGELSVAASEVPVSAVVEEVLAMYRHHVLAEGRELRHEAPPKTVLRTDPTLLRRVLGNLVKNGLEAVPAGSAVSLCAEEQDSQVVFSVQNPGVIAETVQRQIFQRSFSTKEGRGRGIGTHSAKLLTERYLGGRLEFRSSEAEGTVFTVALPLAGPPTG